MTIFTNARCPILSCSSNHGDQGCSCWYASHGLPCGHPRWRREWHERVTGLVEAEPTSDEAPGPAQSLTSRVCEAMRDAPAFTPEMARQRAHQFELELGVATSWRHEPAPVAN